MLNTDGVRKTSYGKPIQILANVEHQVSVGCIVPKTMASIVDGKNIVPAGTLLKNIAKSLGLGVIEIESGEKSNGILASTSALIASKNINIRQAYAEDTYLEEDPVLTIITDEPVPGDIINEFLKLDNVKRVSIY